ncbi:MAG: DUF11 domain-containing protein [Ardenticatenales bacterium]|nr:DUF11 domain-containing protein [Ardenticatenales bacterium]
MEIGETVAYTLTVSNAGPISGTMTVLTDTLSLAASMITMPVASQGSCSATQMPLWVIECDLGMSPLARLSRSATQCASRQRHPGQHRPDGQHNRRPGTSATTAPRS